MIDTPTWVMNAIAPSRAMAGLRPRVQRRSRVSNEAGSALTGPCSLGGQLIRRRGRNRRVVRRNGLAVTDVVQAGATVAGVEVLGPLDPVVPGAGDDDVVPAPGRDEVVALAGEHGVVPRAAEEDVVAGAGQDGVVALGAVDR